MNSDNQRPAALRPGLPQGEEQKGNYAEERPGALWYSGRNKYVQQSKRKQFSKSGKQIRDLGGKNNSAIDPELIRES